MGEAAAVPDCVLLDPKCGYHQSRSQLFDRIPVQTHTDQRLAVYIRGVGDRNVHGITRERGELGHGVSQVEASHLLRAGSENSLCVGPGRAG